MDTVILLDKLQNNALKNEEMRLRLLATKDDHNPLVAFCKICQEYGYDIFPMELINAGEEFHAAMKRSTNGGGENSPKIDGEDDYYELFLASIEKESGRR